MFVQVIQGRTTDPDALLERFDVWMDELRPGAEGWLGATGGVTADGRFISMVRFDSEAAATKNSERPEQGAWWSETAKLLDDATFVNSANVITYLGGGSDDAGFVQIMQGGIADRQRFEEIMNDAEWQALLKERRPELIGGVVALHDGRATAAFYFTSEREARAGESQDADEEQQARIDEFQSLWQEPEFSDLTNPRLSSP